VEFSLYIGTRKESMPKRVQIVTCMLMTSKTQGDIIWTNHQVNQGGTRKCDTTKYCPNYINKPNQHKIGKKLNGINQVKIRYQIEKSSLEGYQINDTTRNEISIDTSQKKDTN
jgi:hypothetical protein